MKASFIQEQLDNQKETIIITLYRAIEARKDFIKTLEKDVVKNLLDGKAYDTGKCYTSISSCRSSLRLMEQEFKKLTGVTPHKYTKENGPIF
jgi:predicted PP-loop superfamily ATPase